LSTQLLVALARGAITCVATGGLTCLGTYETTGKWTPALVAGGISLCTVLVARFGVEGAVDMYRATQAAAAPRSPA
jgi:hypothetical protein